MYKFSKTRDPKKSVIPLKLRDSLKTKAVQEDALVEAIKS